MSLNNYQIFKKLFNKVQVFNTFADVIFCFFSIAIAICGYIGLLCLLSQDFV